MRKYQQRLVTTVLICLLLTVIQYSTSDNNENGIELVNLEFYFDEFSSESPFTKETEPILLHEFIDYPDDEEFDQFRVHVEFIENEVELFVSIIYQEIRDYGRDVGLFYNSISHGVGWFSQDSSVTFTFQARNLGSFNEDRRVYTEEGLIEGTNFARISLFVASQEYWNHQVNIQVTVIQEFRDRNLDKDRFFDVESSDQRSVGVVSLIASRWYFLFITVLLFYLLIIGMIEFILRRHRS
jgi:hypothetical protein